MRPFPDVDQQLETLLEDAAEVIPEDELASKLAASRQARRPLRVKLGIDPSRPDLHLGHAVQLGKLRQFQDFGHLAVLIIGDFTGRIGDPSGQSETRPFVSEAEIEANAKTYFEQAGRVLDMGRAEVRRNSEWLASMSLAEVLRLSSAYTVARMLERDDFNARFLNGRSISVAEFLYPLMQAVDSVAVRSDVEMGGTDQTFNLLVGRDIQREYGVEPQVVFTMPLLVGTDGHRKMSKSFGNYVAVTDSREDMFGKLMRIPDDVIVTYMRLCTRLSRDEIAQVERDLAGGGDAMKQKLRLAREVVALYHGSEAADAAEEHFNRVHRDRELPEDIREVPLPQGLRGAESVWLPRLLCELGLTASNAEGARLIAQGGIRIDGRKVTDPAGEVPLHDLVGRVIQKGRREFLRITGG